MVVFRLIMFSIPALTCLTHPASFLEPGVAQHRPIVNILHYITQSVSMALKLRLWAVPNPGIIL